MESSAVLIAPIDVHVRLSNLFLSWRPLQLILLVWDLINCSMSSYMLATLSSPRILKAKPIESFLSRSEDAVSKSMLILIPFEGISKSINKPYLPF